LQAKKDELYEKLAFLKDEESLQDKNKDFQKEIDNLKNTLSLQMEEKKRLTEDFNKKVEIIKQLENRSVNTKEMEANKEQLKEKEEALERFNELATRADNTQELELLSEQLKEKEDQINKLKEEKEALSHKTLKSDNIRNNELLKEYENKLKELIKFNSLYSQLKEQFEQKQLVLHKTRQELFHVNEQLTAFQREQNNDYKDLNEYEKVIINDLDQTEQELNISREENQNLENLVDVLLSKKTETSKKEDKRDSSEQELLF